MGRVILVDKEDAHWLRHTTSIESLGYVRVYCTPKGERLHRLIMNPPVGMVVDHKNGNPFDNRKSNLRVCTQGQNCLNSSIRRDNSSGVRGVWFDSARGKWCAQITLKGIRKSLGRFETFGAAVAVRLSEERKMWGEFSYERSR